MKDWEIKRRAELELSVKDGAYSIGNGDFVAYTGKGGYINYQIEIERIGRGLQDQVDKAPFYMDSVCKEYKKIDTLTEQDITDFINSFYERSKNKDN